MAQETPYVTKGNDAEINSVAVAVNAAASPLAATGVTILKNGAGRFGVFRVKVDYTAWQAAALTKDLVLANIPAKARLVGITAETTVPYAGPAGTLAIIVGKTTGGAEYLATHDVKTAAINRGAADADLGTAMVRAAAVQGGDLPSFTAATGISARMTSGSGNLSGLTAGSTTFGFVLEFND